ncbi:recombinase family protein [Streptomyces sp. CC228A]|uniref:recombinase family protein n=1 Tax=Streptomyces sp. CC228A TaxID=2898186 RepID=UPI001F48D864|nr:recombinase family protein [Streptomyces sp. CC228A]
MIYARVSYDPRQQLRSVSQQIDECTAECERRGWTLAEVFKDNARSASRYATKERPQYDALIKFLEQGRADVLVTWESSRAQRDLEAYVKLRRVAEDNGVQWSYKGRLYDLTRTDDRFTTGLDALLDERESSMTRDRIMRDKRNHAKKGGPHGRLLFGYVREYDPKTGAFARQIPHPEQAAVVREAARRVAAGESLRTIAVDFNRRKITTGWGKAWQTSGISRMVTNPGYIGQRVHQGKVIGKACWPRLLDDATFYTCVQRLSRPGRSYHRDGRTRHLLTGIVRCGVCGGPMAFINGAVGRASYACRGTRESLSSKCTVVRQERLDDYIERLVIERLSSPDAADLIANDTTAADVQRALEEAAEKRARLDEFYDTAATGKLSASALARIEARLLPEIEAAEKRAYELRVPAVLRDVVRPDIAVVWPTLHLDRRRDVVRTLLNITLLPHQPGSRVDVSKRVEVEWKHDL